MAVVLPVICLLHAHVAIGVGLGFSQSHGHGCKGTHCLLVRMFVIISVYCDVGTEVKS